ncbi:hypothetical protein HOLleu_03415 [Holothuria leucospilota]|uniref:DDE Tnp4 domain-containing protein n=1 Tax=Holothuria leucospilota TaxID=206669 RepID=A0A9Q1HHL5_HOLLE|nr:hypothetical protein HOLleu_03415 [Holothuria leucospilota]
MEGMFNLSETGSQLPFVIVGDEAFPLKPYLMKPYAARIFNQERRIFNYRLSRARRVSENAFGILASRFRVFHTRMAVKPDTAEKVVLAALFTSQLLTESVAQ